MRLELLINNKQPNSQQPKNKMINPNTCNKNGITPITLINKYNKQLDQRKAMKTKLKSKKIFLMYCRQIITTINKTDMR